MNAGSIPPNQWRLKTKMRLVKLANYKNH